MLPTAILIGVFLVPHGIGYRFSIGHVDIPRLIILTVIAYWFVGVLRGFFKSKMIILKPGTKPIVTLVMLILMSAIGSSNPIASTILAGQLCLLWFVFALAYVSLFNDDKDGRLLNAALIMIFVVLFLFALYEVVFQTYLVPHEYRTSFWGIAGYEWITSRVLYRSETVLAQGPFMWNHALSGLCAAGSGLAIYAIDKGKNWGLLFAYIFVILLISAGVRAGFYAVAIAFSLYSVWSKKFSYLLHFSLATLVTDIFYQLYVGSHAPVFFRSDISSHWVEHVPSMSRVQDWFSSWASSQTFLSETMVKTFSSLGPVGVKIMGFLLNTSQIEEWWVLGYGFGSFQRPSQVVSNAIQYDDPGIIQLIFFESGLVAGFLLVFILIRATLLSLRYDSLKYYSVGITAWSLFALSSWEVWPLVLVVIFVFKIFSYDQMQRNSIAETHRNLH
jgi:hypothetical protein